VGDSGEKEGNDVNDLSEIEDALLDMYEAYFRGFARTVCDRALFPDVCDWCEPDLFNETGPASISIVLTSQPST
jgi:hypothetical protein